MSTIFYEAGEYGNGNKVELTNLKLYKDTRDEYCLSAKFKIEDKHSIREIDIPKINLHVRPDRVVLRTSTIPYSERTTGAYIDLGFGELPLGYANVKGNTVLYTEKILEEKYTEMTMDEIEEKLGYKVKIVNK